MRAMVRYAYDNVPFYHKLLNAINVKPTEIKTVNDLKRLPIISRRQVQENYASIISREFNPAKCAKHKTSGSTGVPLTVLTDYRTLEPSWAVSLRQFFESGGRLLDKQVRLRGPGGNPPHAGARPFSEHIGIFRTEWVTIVDEISDAVLSFLKAYKPDVMIGYPGFFQLLSEKTRGELSPRIIFCMGETLSSRCRALMGSAFEARTFDSYGCTETGDIAWECPDEHAGYHINIDSVIVEFINEGESVAPGEEGEIVLTYLFNHAMPFIRYKIGDVGVPIEEQCSCGRTLPLMRSIKGRADDFIVLPDGRKVSPLGILNMENFAGVSEYRIIQEKRDLIEVWLKMPEHYSDDSVKKCVSALRRSLGEGVQIKPRIVEEIPRDNSGKLRRVISKVANC
ncbi:MAG TPA: AMP-binding protein [Candidatus Bathyarchaeia archaeon]|nr:AMP-binding protein [Candidatus Bathyarchaeia archaeon]